MDLKEIHSPRDLDGLSDEQLRDLACDIREQIVQTVSKRGGHLASNLGVVELTIALHRAFNCPQDKIVFDVGHQCYPHKLLTGRADHFDTLRMFNGLCGFPRSEESEYDSFDTGHASSAISAALGMARARDMRGEDYHVVAVVGDGAMTGGMCYEALNDAGSSKTRIIVILNDNGMSISGNVGALSNYLTYLRVSKGWITLKKAISRFLLRIPFCGKSLHGLFQRFKDHMRNIFIRDRFFSSLGFRYFGPIDGQDINSLERVLKRVKEIDEPVLIHVVTKKGYGYAPAEKKPELFHGIPPFCVENGEINPSDNTMEFGVCAAETVMKMAREDKNISVVTAAMTEGTGFSEFKKQFPDRLFDVGIAEEHAVTMAAGLAKSGAHPVVAIYDTFLQRGFDQLLEDVCLQKLPVLFLLDRASLSGHDGSTHHGIFGISYLSPMPYMQIFCPRCITELKQMVQYALHAGGPVAIRYPRNESALSSAIAYQGSFTPGHWETMKAGSDCILLATGAIIDKAIQTGRLLNARGINAEIVNASSIKPLDEHYLEKASREVIPLFTLEENVLSGGFGALVSLFCAEHGLNQPKHLFAIHQSIVRHGTRDELLAQCGLDEKTIADCIFSILKGEKK